MNPLTFNFTEKSSLDILPKCLLSGFTEEKSSKSKGEYMTTYF